MRIDPIEVYTFDELSAKAKEHALENERTSDCLHIHYDYDYYKELLNEYGFLGPTIYWTGFWSQGDGACFEIKGFDVLTYLTKTKQKTKYKKIINQLNKENLELVGTIHRNQFGHHYEHANSRYFELETLDYEDVIFRLSLQELIDDLEKNIERQRYDLSNQIYRSLEKDYEAQTSDEYLSEHLTVNQVEYRNDGRLHH